jgi:hypothetical protein
LGNTKLQKHIKGSKGGNQISIEEGMQNFVEVKSYLTKQVKALSGNMMKLFAKSVVSIVVMVQKLLNQPIKTFMTGFTDIVPYKLCLFISRIKVP